MGDMAREHLQSLRPFHVPETAMSFTVTMEIVFVVVEHNFRYQKIPYLKASLTKICLTTMNYSN